MRCFRKTPDWKTLGLTYEDALRIRDRKSAWMVHYLRGRRTNDPLTPFFRRQHLGEPQP